MTKKRVQFDLDEEQVEIGEESKLPFNKKFKHTLDSDESDDEIEDEKKYKLDQETLDGEEEGNLHRDGEITITPFNIKDELNEGHFDDQGMYIFNKDTDEIKDNWIDNIDWEKIKEVEQTKTKEEPNEKVEQKIDLVDCLSRLIELMNPNETVQKAIQRLGKSKLNNLNRNKNRQKQKNNSKDQNKTDEQLKAEQEDKERKDKLDKLIEVSNQLLSDGDMNIYETKYEAIKYRLDERSKSQSNEELDMFSN